MEITIKQYEISIVVLGTFQPSKITPKWMFNNGVVSAGEWEQLQENMMVSPPASKFQFGDIEFICQQERIQVRTADISKSGRLQQMVSVIVDLCNQTELVALGVNSELKFTFLTEKDSMKFAKILSLLESMKEFMEEPRLKSIIFENNIEATADTPRKALKIQSLGSETVVLRGENKEEQEVCLPYCSISENNHYAIANKEQLNSALQNVEKLHTVFRDNCTAFFNSL